MECPRCAEAPRREDPPRLDSTLPRGLARAGGVATFHLLPAFGADGHRLVDRVELWKAAADDFLRRLNLSSR